MAYLDQTIVTVDAILTAAGRRAIAEGRFNITQFALCDDDISYLNYNPNHPSGSAFYGEAIENSPVSEAVPNESQLMKYKLITLPRGTSKLPVLNLGYTSITLKQGATLSVTPQTLNYLSGGSNYEPSGYVCTIADARLLSTFTGIGIDLSTVGGQPISSNTNVSKTQIGTSFTLTGTTINTLFGTTKTSITTQLIVVGRDSGARVSIPLTVTKNQ